MRVLNWLHSLPGRINRSFATISGATGFEAGAGKLTTYVTGVNSLNQRMERSAGLHDGEERDAR